MGIAGPSAVGSSYWTALLACSEVAGFLWLLKSAICLQLKGRLNAIVVFSLAFGMCVRYCAAAPGAGSDASFSSLFAFASTGKLGLGMSMLANAKKSLAKHSHRVAAKIVGIAASELDVRREKATSMPSRAGKGDSGGTNPKVTLTIKEPPFVGIRNAKVKARKGKFAAKFRALNQEAVANIPGMVQVDTQAGGLALVASRAKAICASVVCLSAAAATRALLVRVLVVRVLLLLLLLLLLAAGCCCCKFWSLIFDMRVLLLLLLLLYILVFDIRYARAAAAAAGCCCCTFWSLVYVCFVELRIFS